MYINVSIKENINPRFNHFEFLNCFATSILNFVEERSTLLTATKSIVQIDSPDN